MLETIENRGIHNAAGTVSIRRLKVQDVPAAVRLTHAVRWPHTEEDWRPHLQLGQGWVANDSGTLLGSAMTWSYGQAAGTTGLIVVDQAQHGRGIGRRLFARSLEDLGSRAVQLVATDAGLWLCFGFEITATIVQHQGNVRPVPAQADTEAIGMRAVCDADTETLIELDAAASTLARAGFGSTAAIVHDSNDVGPHVDMLTEVPQSGLNDPGVGLREHRARFSRRVLTCADLCNYNRAADQRDPTREIQLHLTGDMSRYMRSFSSLKFADAEPLVLRYGERVRITLINDTMMTHPIHLHGLWREFETEDPDYLPRKHTVIVQPGAKISYLVTANAYGRRAYHCH